MHPDQTLIYQHSKELRNPTSSAPNISWKNFTLFTYWLQLLPYFHIDSLNQSRKWHQNNQIYILPWRTSSKLPPGKKSYINSFDVGELQYPLRLTRDRCLMLPRISSSLSKNRSKPSFILTILFKANTLPSSIASLYTVPKPPEPIMCSSFNISNFFIISLDV